MIEFKYAGIEFNGEKLQKEMPYKIQYGVIKNDTDDLLDEGTPYLSVYIFDENKRERNGTYETLVTDENGNETWQEFDITTIKSQIDGILANHDPVPMPKPPTLEEKIEKLPDEVERLKDENIAIMLASVDSYESLLAENTQTMVAMTEMFEMIMGGM